MNTFVSRSLEDLSKTAADFINIFSDARIFCFYGQMGVGKTTFIKEICKQLGVTDITNSPTFAIVNEYQTNHGNIIYHFDFYRFNTPSEAYDIGIEEYFFSNNYCFIEWPEKAEAVIPEDAIRIRITEENEMRLIEQI